MDGIIKVAIKKQSFKSMKIISPVVPSLSKFAEEICVWKINVVSFLGRKRSGWLRCLSLKFQVLRLLGC